MGKIEIDHTGSGSGITLSSDGTSLLLDGSAIGGGGGGADLYAANESMAHNQAPRGPMLLRLVTGQLVAALILLLLAILELLVYMLSHLELLIMAHFMEHRQIIQSRLVRMQFWAYTGTALGHYSHAESGHAVAIGRARASGGDSLAAAISTNSIYMAQEVLEMASRLVRMQNRQGQGLQRLVTRSVSSGTDSHAFGRSANNATSELAFAFGYNAKANVIGCFAFSAYGLGGENGSSQGRQYILVADTTDATATVLTTDNGATPSVFNCPRVDNDTVIAFDGVISATQNGAQAYAGWKVEGLIVSDGGTVTMAASTVTAIQNTPNWGMALTADDSSNILKITATGEASHNIRWVANLRTVETTYA